VAQPALKGSNWGEIPLWPPGPRRNLFGGILPRGLKFNLGGGKFLCLEIEPYPNFFHKALEGFKSPVTIANIVTNEVARELKHKRVDELKFTPKDIAQLAKMVDEETISTKIAKQVYEEMAKSGQNPIDIVEERGLKQISDPDILLPIIDEVISKNPQNVEKYRNGNRKLFGFFVGQVLKATKGRGNPRIVNRLIKNLLG